LGNKRTEAGIFSKSEKNPASGKGKEERGKRDKEKRAGKNGTLNQADYLQRTQQGGKRSLYICGKGSEG